MADTSYNARTDKINTSTRQRSEAERMIDSQSDQAADILDERPRGEEYRKKIEQQRRIAQRLRQLSEKDEISGGGLRVPRNAKFQNQKEGRIERMPTTDAVFIGAVALLFDTAGGIISLIDFVAPPVGEIINAVTVFPAATLTLYLLYKKRGIVFTDTKTLLRFWGSLLVGFIPYLALLPEYLLNVVLVTIATKAEDRLKR
jgi:hypothetical protein